MESKQINRRGFLKLMAASGAALALSSCNKKISEKIVEATETPVLATEIPPFIPHYERVNKKGLELPEDVISPEDLWTSYHTRIWQAGDDRIYLRPGIKEMKIFQDLREGKIDLLDIVVLESENRLTEEQKKYLGKGFQKIFDQEIEEKSNFFSGKIISFFDYESRSNRVVIVTRQYGEDECEMATVSYPDPVNERVATWPTIMMTLRHELQHWESPNSGPGVEEFTGFDSYEKMKNAHDLYQKGDDSGYFVVWETENNVVVA